MPIEWDVYLGANDSSGKLSAFGRKVTIREKETVREQRAADGTLKRDILYVKYEFEISYSNTTESNLDIIDAWYYTYQNTKTPLSLYMYTSPTGYLTYTVVPKPVDRTRVVKGADNLFSGVKLVLIEV